MQLEATSSTRMAMNRTAAMDPKGVVAVRLTVQFRATSPSIDRGDSGSKQVHLVVWDGSGSAAVSGWSNHIH